MTDKDYIQKLSRFNSTDKYFQELYIMYGLVQPMKNQKILDYGCGIGTAVKYFKNITDRVSFMGYDVKDYMRQISPYSHHLFVEEVPECDTVYFMHSFAHVPEISKVIFELREKVRDKVIVITPNADWIRLQKNENYTPDPTVVHHYDMKELIDIFEDCGYKIMQSGQFGEYTEGQHERLFLVAKP